MTGKRSTARAHRLLLALLLFAMALWLGYAVLTLHASPAGLEKSVAAEVDLSGVSNPVTAVLLNFRGYDTLLEMGVLFLALLGVWSLDSKSDSRESLPGPVLDTLTRLLVPGLILVAGYLLWVGADAPGGAFQAGSVLGAAGVLLLLCGWRLDQRFTGLLLRSVLVMGLVVFVLTGIGLRLIGGEFLQYPPAAAGALILLIEAAATLSIGATLAALFKGAPPTAGPDQ